MAKTFVVEHTDDLDGSTIADGTGESIEFSLDGVDYTIDLKDKNAEKFRTNLEKYLAHATRVGGRKRRPSPAGTTRTATPSATTTARDREQTRAIRDWATANGYDISPRGRIPDAIVQAYTEAPSPHG